MWSVVGDLRKEIESGDAKSMVQVEQCMEAIKKYCTEAFVEREMKEMEERVFKEFIAR